MSGRLGRHIRSNVIGYVALFLALSTGSAVALRGSNSVFSDDIVNGAVKTQDINDTSGVRSVDVRNDTFENGGLQAADLRSDSVGSGEVIDGSVGTSELSSAIPAARVTNSADESTIHSLGESLPFDTERYDTADVHATENSSRLTAPVKGIYAVSASVVWSSDPDGTRFVGLRKNGDTWIAMQTQPAVAGNPTDQEVSHQLLLQTGDYVEVRAHQSSGGPLTVVKFNATSPEFAMTWLAPGP
jgi:uncharacterized protein YidB (DUF937 family)